MKLSELFERAINEKLARDEHDIRRQEFSCNAVSDVCGPDEESDKAMDFLEELGVDPDSGNEFNEFIGGFDIFNKESQQARALWLTWAAMIAKEEGK